MLPIAPKLNEHDERIFHNRCGQRQVQGARSRNCRSGSESARQLGQDVKAGLLRQLQIQQRNIGLKPLQHVQSFLDAARIAHHDKLQLLFKRLVQSIPEEDLPSRNQIRNVALLRAHTKDISTKFAPRPLSPLLAGCIKHKPFIFMRLIKIKAQPETALVFEDQLVMDCEEGKFQAIEDTHLVEDIGYVVFSLCSLIENRSAAQDPHIGNLDIGMLRS